MIVSFISAPAIYFWQTDRSVTAEIDDRWIDAGRVDDLPIDQWREEILLFQRQDRWATFEQKELTLVLDGIQDPGNLGTIIRLCDWFGIEFLVCSRDTADCFNPKVVQSSMGSLARVQVVYTDLKYFLKEQQAVSYGALLEGENVYQTGLSEKAVLVMGNEGKGISPEIAEIMDKKIHIPQFGVDQETESLNVGTATAILLSEFRRGRFTGKQN